jgi:Pao retrotransposon peptidase/Family of unknown function (DUF5641)/Protein of unknown function (DUF1759)/Integrase zinc binding domain
MNRPYVQRLPTFEGNVKDWPVFIAMYESTTREGGFTEADNIGRLREALKGDALKYVFGLLQYSTKASEVIEALRQVYGRTDILIVELTEELLTIENMKSETDGKLKDFSLSITCYVQSMKALNRPAELENSFVLEKLASKLVYTHFRDWRRFKAMKPRVNLEDFAQFLVQLVIEIPADRFSSCSREQPRSSGGRLHAHHEESGDNGQNGLPNWTGCFNCRGSHRLTRCEKFRTTNVEGREFMARNLKVCLSCLSSTEHNIQNCPTKRPCGINGCKGIHNRLLHSDRKQRGSGRSQGQNLQDSSDRQPESGLNVKAIEFKTNSEKAPSGEQGTVNITTHQLQSHQESECVLYKIVPVRLTNETGTKSIETYAFLDDGSSLTLLENEIYEALQLEGISETLRIHWTGGIKRQEEALRTKVIISGIKGGKSFHLRNVHAISGLDLPVQSVNTEALQARYKHLRGLAIPSMVNARPQVLIGLKHACLLTGDSQRTGNLEDPLAVKTPLGWTVYGASAPSLQISGDSQESGQSFQLTMHEATQGDEELHNIVKQHFSTEGFGTIPLKQDLIGDENKRSLSIMRRTLRRVGRRREIGLLWKHDKVRLPNSLPMALKRLEAEEKSLKRRGLLEWKKAHIQDLIAKGHARIATQEELERKWDRIWYCPHFVVVNVNKVPPKPRDVADVAAKVKGISLNSQLLSGPNNLAPLLCGLLKVREKKYAVNADVKEMFHQVVIKETDQQCQRFLWRDGDCTKDPTVYIMQRMMFGPTCSPAEAQFVKNTHAMEYMETMPEAAEALIQYMYVDDYFNSHSTLEDAERISLDAISICSDIGFELVGFQSNSQELLARLPERNVKAGLISMDCRDTENYVTKILGMYWHSFADYFTFKLSTDETLEKMKSEDYRPTKREMLRVVMRIFDPLGLIALYTIRGKIILQEVWREGTEWDEPIPLHLQKPWFAFVSQLPNLEKLIIPRQYAPVNPTDCKIQLIVFVDASEQAFAATAYARFIAGTEIFVAHIMGKARVAPVKKLTIPQLELQAAVLGIRLADTIKRLHSMNFERTYFISDSKTVLKWITSSTYKFKTFVAVRVGEILDSSSRAEWFHIRSNNNVADDATKWTDPTMGNVNVRWFQGPEFLKQDVGEWPISPAVSLKDDEATLEETYLMVHINKVVNVAKFTVLDAIAPRFKATWPRMIRVVSFMLRFKSIATRTQISLERAITPEEFRLAEVLVFRKIQHEAFPEIIEELTNVVELETKGQLNHRQVSKSCSLRKLSPIMSSDLVIRASTRAQLAKISYASKNPVILPNKHPLVDLFVQHFHERNFHFGEDTTVGDIREVAWIVDIHRAVRRVTSRCQFCKNKRAAPKNPLMGLLPEPRLAFGNKPFTHVGIDGFGPFLVRFGRGNVKRYGLILTCLTFRAVHIEMLRDMTTNQVLMALRRFFSARGASQKFYSDNGTNFVGARNTLHKDLKELKTEVGEKVANGYLIQWSFIPAYSPWFGGAWERLIHSIKKCVEFVSAGEISHDDVLETALKDASFLMNRRPLSHVPIDHQDAKPLTPNTALFGEDEDTNALAPGIFTGADAFSRLGYRRAQHLTTKFMSRWIREYLPEINRREKWHDRTKPVQIGDVVVVTEPNEPRNAWKKGRITKLYPGFDQEIRAVDVVLADGTIKPSRSVGRLAVLDVLESSTGIEETTSAEGGGMSADHNAAVL